MSDKDRQLIGGQSAYVVLSPQERAKGFVKPVRTVYKHVTCSRPTQIHLEIAETFARDPRFYTGTFCTSCRDHFPLEQFVWEPDGEPMDPALQHAWNEQRKGSSQPEHVHKSNMEPWKQRVIEEKRDLDGRLSRLQAFIGSASYLVLQTKDQELLQEQLTLMCSLSDVLSKRINKR